MNTNGSERALIVGAGSGLSASLARLLSNEGMTVAMAARNPDKLDDLCQKTGATAYPDRLLPEGRIITDTVDSRPVIVARTPQTKLLVAWAGSVDGAAVKLPSRAATDLVVDDVSKSTLNLATGTFTTGPLKDKKLTPVKFTRLYWFAWADYYPRSRIWGQAVPATGSGRDR